MSPTLDIVSMNCGRSDGGAGRIRTGDRLLAKQMLCQLSYDPFHRSINEILKRKNMSFKVTLCDQLKPILSGGIVFRPSAQTL